MQQAQILLDNRYSILHIESMSSFSKVFFALDTYQNPSRNCVIKVFEPIIQKIPTAQWIEQSFQTELKHLKQLSLLNHHLPEIYTYSSEFQVYYIVRELVEGETLREKVQNKGTFTTQEVREILIKLLSVLEYLHEEGVIHQNIRPKNVILRDDDVPMPIDFGSVKQIFTTYGFYDDRRLFSLNNTYGYVPSEQIVGKSVPASDLYSLGLTAVYLLTSINPVDLPIDLTSGNFHLPAIIEQQDSNLAKILNRAISHNLSDRYSCASEMKNALLARKYALNKYKFRKEGGDLNSIEHQNQGEHYPVLPKLRWYQTKQSNQNSSNWFKAILYIMGGLYTIEIGVVAWHKWHLSQNAYVPQLPEPSILLPSTLPELSQPVSKQPSILNTKSDNVVEIPIFATGTQKIELRKALGEPNAIKTGYWEDSIAWIYQNRANGSIDLGYLFDLNSDKIRQTEVAIAPSISLSTIQEILASLLQGNIDPVINKELEKIYNRQADRYSFRLGGLKGSIEREDDEHIYLGVWEADFH